MITQSMIKLPLRHLPVVVVDQVVRSTTITLASIKVPTSKPILSMMMVWSESALTPEDLPMVDWIELSQVMIILGDGMVKVKCLEIKF